MPLAGTRRSAARQQLAGIVMGGGAAGLSVPAFRSLKHRFPRLPGAGSSNSAKHKRRSRALEITMQGERTAING